MRNLCFSIWGNVGQVSALLAVVMLIAACQPKVMLMPTPEIIRNPRFDVFAHNPNLDKTNKVTTFYATNRLPSKDPDDLNYTKTFDHTLRFGTAVLQIGSEQQNWQQLYAESTTAERVDEFELSLTEVNEMASFDQGALPNQLPDNLKPFFSKLNEAIAKSIHQDITVYAHGANSNFYRATAQAAQYQYFTGNQSVVLTFAWPSAENILKYQIDAKHTHQTMLDFSRLLEMLAKYSSAKHINIIAYSAGGRLTGAALGELGVSYANKSIEQARAELRFGNMYMTSSDEPLLEFVNLLSTYIDFFDNITITANPDDSVLEFAQFTDDEFRLGKPPTDASGKVKIGLTEEKDTWLTKVVNSGDLDIINLQVNEIPGFEFFHGAWYENPWVSSDVSIAINFGLKPSERGLKTYTSESGRIIWYFPKDYLENLTASLNEHLTKKKTD